MPRKFPKTREDGTFCVVAKFTTTHDATALRDQVNEWCKQWIAENNDASGKPVVIGTNVIKEPRDYFRAFTNLPGIIKAQNNQLWLRFDGASASYWWKDWLVRIVESLTDAFPDLQPIDQRVSFNNCDE